MLEGLLGMFLILAVITVALGLAGQLPFGLSDVLVSAEAAVFNALDVTLVPSFSWSGLSAVNPTEGRVIAMWLAWGALIGLGLGFPLISEYFGTWGLRLRRWSPVLPMVLIAAVALGSTTLGMREGHAAQIAEQQSSRKSSYDLLTGHSDTLQQWDEYLTNSVSSIVAASKSDRDAGQSLLTEFQSNASLLEESRSELESSSVDTLYSSHRDTLLRMYALQLDRLNLHREYMRLVVENHPDVEQANQLWGESSNSDGVPNAKGLYDNLLADFELPPPWRVK